MAVKYSYARTGYNVSATNKNINLDTRMQAASVSCEYINYEAGILDIYMSRSLSASEETALIDILDNGPQTTEIVVSNTDVEGEVSNPNNSPMLSVYTLVFNSTNITSKGRWMTRDSSMLITSDSVPFIVPWDSRIVGYTFVNEKNDEDVDIKIYATPFSEEDNDTNKVLKDTIELRNCRYSAENMYETEVTFNAGDKIAVWLDPVGNSKIRNSIFTVYLQVISPAIVSLTKQSNTKDF